ncbi:hypothetical protein ACK280_26975 [Mycobacterium sherrisii]|uniref:hypothetical protein n=1 Tax=Mycobacterium sherrisii TaxID=243061 RepID=UPI003974ADD5
MAPIVCNIAPGRMDAPFFHPQEPPSGAELHASQAMGKRLTKIDASLAVFLAGNGDRITRTPLPTTALSSKNFQIITRKNTRRRNV